MKNRIRLYFQLTALLLILYVAIRPLFDKGYLADFEKYCPFGGISSFFSKINQNTLACNMSETQIILGFGLLIAVGLIGKLFCSFICPIGSTSEWLGKLGKRFKLQKEFSKNTDRYLRGLKYILLFITIYFTMTTSELFCKKFDPYFSAVNIFGNIDIVLLYAIPAFILTIAGAFFLRLAWCKYLCPLSAASNIFLNPVSSISIIFIFLIANFFGANLNIIWLLAAVVLVGWLNESVLMRSVLFPLPKITRDLNGCTDCGNCDKKCPQGIKVSELPVVNHIDCNLCTDCLYACPFKNVLTINKRKKFKYFVPSSVVVIIAICLLIADYVEFTTISMRWGNRPNNEAVYEQAGLKTIKCYGSSMALAGTIESIEGIYGLDTYAKSHKIKIYYDPTVISENQVKSALFTPSKMILREPINTIDSVNILDIGIYRLFDAVDFSNLKYLLQEKQGILGFETRFGEPIKTTIYFYSSMLTVKEIIEQLQKKSFKINTNNGEETIEPGFSPEKSWTVNKTLTKNEYLSKIFNNYDDRFNSYEDYDLNNILVFKFPMEDAGKPELRKYLDYLSSHLSGNEGIVRFSIRYDNGVTGYIYYISSKTTEEAVSSALKNEKLSFFVSDTEKEEIKNPFSIQPKGKSFKVSEINETENK